MEAPGPGSRVDSVLRNPKAELTPDVQAEPKKELLLPLLSTALACLHFGLTLDTG